MNLKLRNRYIQGNFKIYSIGPVLDLTFPVKVIGSNINTVKKIVEGNHYICQNLIHSKNPLIIYNSEFFKNSTSNALLENLSKFVQTFTSEKISLNMVNSSLTESSSSYIGTLKKVSKKSFSDSSITYCLNTELDTELVKKTINLKLLNYILTSNIKPNYLINQNCLKTNLVLPLNFSATANLPSLSFVEESGNFFTTEGFLKKSLKVVSNKTIKKSNWEILRKIFSLLNSTFSLNNNNSIVLNLKNNTLFLNFLNLNYFSIQNFKNNKNVLAFKKGNLNLNIVPNKNNFKKKFFKSNILFWYNDFYTGNKNCYSKYSKVMIECSIKARLQNTNFKIIL
jgi:NADH dehydrogenase/NADH:ubiquinone oxidoreductase subunit G